MSISEIFGRRLAHEKSDGSSIWISNIYFINPPRLKLLLLNRYQLLFYILLCLLWNFTPFRMLLVFAAPMLLYGITINFYVAAGIWRKFRYSVFMLFLMNIMLFALCFFLTAFIVSPIEGWI